MSKPNPTGPAELRGVGESDGLMTAVGRAARGGVATPVQADVLKTIAPRAIGSHPRQNLAINVSTWKYRTKVRRREALCYRWKNL